MKGGMTREEALISYSCGVRQFIIAVNKMDTVLYKEARFLEVTNEMINILIRFGVPKEKICAIPISGFYGENLISPSKLPELSWFKGYPFKKNNDIINVTYLSQAIDALTLPPRPNSAPLRIPIQNVYKVSGVGTVVIGRVASGTLKNGDTVCLNCHEGFIKSTIGSIEIFYQKKAEVCSGDIVGFSLRGVKLETICRGMVVSDPNNKPASLVKQFTAQIFIFSHPGELKIGYSPIYHCHTADFTAKWTKILHKVDRKTGKISEENPISLKQGDIGVIEVEIKNHPVELEVFTDFAPLGRFVMRDGGRTVGFGSIKSIVPASKAPSVHAIPKVKPKFLKK
jgi:elongation factor 1-alpha